MLFRRISATDESPTIHGPFTTIPRTTRVDGRASSTATRGHTAFVTYSHKYDTLTGDGDTAFRVTEAQQGTMLGTVLQPGKQRLDFVRKAAGAPVSTA